jgi:hypothetical protein
MQVEMWVETDARSVPPTPHLIDPFDRDDDLEVSLEEAN